MTEKELEGIWIVDPVKGTRLAALEAHYEAHCEEVGAADMEQYVRQAVAFRAEAKKRNGAGRLVIGRTPGVRSWKKAGRYIFLAPNNEIVSFGAADQTQDANL